MTRTPLSIILSLALALPQLSTPAYADQRDYAHRHGTNGPIHRPVVPPYNLTGESNVNATIAALGGLAIAAALAKQARDRREEERAREQRQRDEARKQNEARRHNDRHHGHSHNQRRAPLKVLPERCYRRGNGPYGEWRGWSARCLQRHVAQPRLLPFSCVRTVETWQGPRDIYRNRCLRRAGWSRRAARH